MPTYEYLCESCGHEFEQFQGITAKPMRKCPKCGERSLKRLIGTGAGVIFKGPGFYQTDYRSESYKKAAKSEKGKPDEDVKEKTSAESKESKPSEKSKAGTSKKKSA
jgi:putative FmdB family regulatory protein